MKLIVDVPHEIICKRYLGENDKIWLVHAVKNGKPLFDALNEIKGEIEHTACKQYNRRLMLDREEIIEIIDDHIKNC